MLFWATVTKRASKLRDLAKTIELRPSDLKLYVNTPAAIRHPRRLSVDQTVDAFGECRLRFRPVVDDWPGCRAYLTVGWSPVGRASVHTI